MHRATPQRGPGDPPKLALADPAGEGENKEKTTPISALFPSTSSSRYARLVQGPILGLDFGTRRIGLAVSDDAAAIAFPIGVLESRGRERDLGALAELAGERGVKRVVVGLPLHLDGVAGEMAEAARAFAVALADRSGLPVDLLDERWTSLEAERTLREAPRPKKRRRQKGAVDTLAATLILRTYLERSQAAAARAGAAR